MVKLTLAFGEVLLKTHGKALDLIDYTYKVLENTNPRKISKGSNTIVSFLDITRKKINGTKCLVGFYGYALGDTYQIIDPEHKTISHESYPTPPFAGKAMFVLLESGYLIFEEKTATYIEPLKIKESLESAYREYAVEMPVKIQMLELADSSNTMIEFVYALKRLISIEFSNLRHSNPSERSRYFDEATNSRIDNIAESTSNPAGIDRDSELFSDQISHIKHSYGKIKRAEGLDSKGLAVMESSEGTIRLTVTLENQEESTKIMKMLEVFKQISDKLTNKN
ncbi:hypothetical protein [Methanomethylovorans sp.]|uniref:hypothetical protein n=1 Tax=Methanomethylovorans sp. TaxID=2758717 RepID=UPI002FDE0248